ncbi:MAG: RagB/SusD family nutrient uptake outer membrane protein, partial [Odoribacter sp.]|nr:RagB/SusD family nutrient uptake outer membrane protein [Odoribacter sp.]
MKKRHTIIAVLLSSVLLFGCGKDYLDIEPSNYATGDQIEDIATSNPDALINVVEPLIQGIYNYLNQYNTQNSASTVHNDFGLMSIYHLGDVMNDDLAFEAAGSGWFTYDYALDYRSEQYIRPFFYWNFFYTVIAKANDIISKIPDNVDNAELRAIRGQALVLRGFSHFYVVQMYQQTYKGNEDAPGVPVIITPTEAAKQYRVPVREVYEQIIEDFTQGLALLDGWTRPNKVKINKNVAAGLFSRVHLVMENWKEAVKYARMAREGASVLTIQEYESEGFNDINSKEWLWGADITSETKTSFASFFSFVCTYDAGYGGDVGQYRKIDAKLYNAIPATSVWRKKFKDPSLPVNEKSNNTEEKVPSYT